jgi:hypothetical protein
MGRDWASGVVSGVGYAEAPEGAGVTVIEPSHDAYELEDDEEEDVGRGPCSARSVVSNANTSSPCTLRFHSRYPHISRSIWLISFSANIFCATIPQD